MLTIDPSKTATFVPQDIDLAALMQRNALARLDAQVEGASGQDAIEKLLMQLALSGADAKTLILARQILDCDQMISDNLKEIDYLNKERKVHAERKQELQSFKAFVNKYGKDGKLSVEDWAKHWDEFVDKNPKLAAKYELDPAKPPTIDTFRSHGYGHQGIGDYSFTMHQVIHREGPHIRAVAEGAIFSGDSVTVDELDAAILRHDDAIQQLDQAKELTNLRNQQALQRKQRTLTLLSNMNAAEHEGRKAVIANTRA